MTNLARMTNSQLREALEEAVATSAWHFDDRAWMLAEQWSLRAQELHQEVTRRTGLRSLADSFARLATREDA